MIENQRTEPRIADTIHTDSFKALGFNPIRQVTDRSDMELYSSDMGMAMADRVAVRDFYRLRYGNGFRVQHGRDMNDGEVDGAIRKTYGIDSEDIDYTSIKQKQQKELQFYTGDYENLEAKEWLSGTLGGFLEATEGVVEEGGRLFSFIQEGFENIASPSRREEIREEYSVIRSKLDEFVDILPEEMRGDLEELRARAGDADALSVSAMFAAFLTNAPNFAGGFMPAWAGMSFMYAQEKKHSLEAFEDIFDVPRMLPKRKEFSGNDDEYNELLTRYDLAQTYASLYAAVSGGIEYFQTKSFKKLAGLKGQSIQREYTRTMLSQIKKVFPEAAFNVGEELSQQLVYNQVFNAAIKKAKDFGIEKEKVAWNDGLYDSALGSARISAILAPVGASVRGVQARNYVRQTEQGLIDSGFSKAMAREYARKMADAAGDPEQFRAITEEINGVYETIDIASKAKIEEKKAAQIYDETGRITMGGKILTDADFDQMATVYNEQELRDLIRNVTEKDLFVDAVYGNTEARRDYNKLILDVVDEALETEFPDEEEPDEQVDRKPFTVAGVELDQEYDINTDTETVINNIINGEFDGSLEVAEGQTIEEAREAAVKQTIEQYGTPIEQKVNEATDDVDQTAETEERKPKVNKNKKRRLAKERKKMVERAERALRVVAPGVEVVLIDNNDDFIKRTGAFGNGYYDMKNTIFLNGDSATQGTVAHEVVHAVFHQKFKNTENIRIAADRILNQMLKHSLSEKTKAEIKAFQQMYIDLSARLLEEGDAASSERVLKELDEEGIAQLASILLNNYDALKPTLRSQIQDFLATIFKGIVSFSDEGRAIEMLRVLAYKTTAGERILEDDLALLDEMAAEMPEGYESQGETSFRADKFQLSYYDEDSNLSYYYDMDSQQWDELEAKGFITRDRSIRNFNGMTIMLHQPDAFFSGSIERNGQVLVSGAGGVFYPLKFNDQGYFWASTKGGASQIVNTLNEVAKVNGGTILMGLTSAPRGKEFGSTKGANAVLDLFRSLAQDSKYDFTLTELNKIVKKASRHVGLNTSGLKTLQRKFGALNSTFDARAEFTREVIREVGKLAQSKPEFNKQLLAFYKSIKIYNRPVADIKEGQTKKEATADQIAEGQKGDLGTLGLRHIAEMLAEPVLKNAIEGEPTMQRSSGGELYAVLEINGPLKLVETYEHESYPFAVASEDGNKPVIHMLKDRYMWDTAVINPNTGKQITGISKSKLYPPTSGISKPFTVHTQGKAQLSSDSDVEDTTKKKIKIATFFSGLGTVELALLDAMGFEVVSTAEIEQSVIDTYNLTHGTAEIPTDVLKLKVQELIDKGVQFIHMSPPCQAFSAAREKGKVTEENFKLEMKIARKLAKIITEVQPDNITIENAPAYQDSAQYAVIRKALGKAGYYVEESTPDAQNYGGNSMRTRLIVRASKTPLPDMPKEHRDGDWYPAMAKFIPEAPVDEAIQFEGRSGRNMMIVQDLLGRIYDHNFDPNVAYIAPGGDGFFKPQGGAGNALTANFVYDEKKRKAGIKEKKKLEDGSLYGSSAVMRIALPVRKMVQEKGLKYTAKYYGATVKQVQDAYDNIGFLVKRGTTEMYLAYMNLPTDATMSDNVQLNRAMLGNGIQGVITREFIAPMIGKAQLPDDFLERQIEIARQEREAVERQQLEREREAAEEPEDFDDEVDVDLDDPDEFYDEFVDEDQLFPDETIEGATKLTNKEIKILLMNMGEVLSSPRGKRFATLIANAAKNCNPIDVKNLALQALEEDLILSDQQHAMFVYRVTQLRNEIEELRDAMENAQYGNTSVDLSRKYEDKLAEMSLLVKADAKSGSATGRALNARRIALNNDYSLASCIRRASAAKSRLGNSGDLTPEEQKNIADAQAKWEKTQSKIIEYQNKQYTTVRDTDIKAGNLFVKKAQSDRGTKAAKKSLNNKDKLIKRLKDKGYNIEGFGKNQLFNISPSLAIDIREMAKVLVYEGFNDLDSVVNEIKGVLPDTLEYDIYGAISGRVQRVPKTETEARKILKALTLQSDLIVQINNAMDNLFDPDRVQAPKSVEVQALRAKLEELKKASRESAREDAAAARMLAEINNIELMIEGLYRPVRKPSKKQSERISDMADRLFTKRAELRAQDKLILLRTIIDYGEPPKFARTKRNPQSQRLEQYRAEIALLEGQIKETRRIKADEARKARLEAEQKARLDELTSQVAGWYRANVAPKQQAKLNDVQVSIKEKQRLLKQQDRIAELTEILETGRLPERDAPQIKTETEYTETINELQEQIRQQEWYQQMQQIKFEEKRKANVLAKIEEQERVVREKDFATYLTPKEKKEILDPELKDLLIVQRENERLIRRAINDLKPKTTLERVADYISLPRAFMATADMSAVFRQAFLLGVRHPAQFTKAVRTSAKAMFDPQFASQVMTILDNDEMSLIRQGAGLFFSSLDTGLLTSEEAFSSAALEQVYKIPGVGKPISAVMGASERHMVIMLNVMRAASFDAFVEANPNATELELKSMAHYINTASGRGDLYALEGASTALSAFFFSPRFAMSRLMVGLEGGAKLSKGFLKGEERIVAEEIARQWGAALTTWAIVGTLAVLAGAEIGDDPEESDFGLIKMGRTRLDFFAGMGPMMRLLAKFGDSAIKRISGEEVKVDLSTQVLNTFFKYKASPWIGTTIELFTGKRYVTRQDVSPLTTIVEKAFPISLVNLYQGIQEEHSFQEIATEFSGEFVGLGVQTRKPKKKKKSKTRKRVTY